MWLKQSLLIPTKTGLGSVLSSMPRPVQIPSATENLLEDAAGSLSRLGAWQSISDLSVRYSLLPSASADARSSDMTSSHSKLYWDGVGNDAMATTAATSASDATANNTAARSLRAPANPAQFKILGMPVDGTFAEYVRCRLVQRTAV